jgi:hypothetical protein
MNTQTTPSTRPIDWINCGLLVLILLLVFSRSSNTTEPVDRSEISLALSKIDDSLKSKDFQSAYDMLMVALRIAPSEPKILASIESFVTAATDTDSDEAESLAEDLVGRSDALVAFQSPSTVADARKRVNALQERVFASSKQTGKVDSIDTSSSNGAYSDVEQLIKIADNSELKVSHRTRAVQQARVLLDEIEFESLSHGNLSSAISSNVISEFESKLEQAEGKCLEILFQNKKTEVDAWNAIAKKSSSQLEASVPLRNQVELEATDKVIANGLDLIQQITPFVKTDVEGAITLVNKVSKKVDLLQRMKNWLYNKRALAIIGNAEASNGIPLRKLSDLAKLREEILSNYVISRLNEVWDRNFQELSDGLKVEAVKMRIVGEQEDEEQ